MRAVTLLCLLLGCGQVRLEVIDVPVDAANIDAANIDANLADVGERDSNVADVDFVDAFVDASVEDARADIFDGGTDADRADVFDAGSDAADASVVRSVFGAPVLLGELSAGSLDADDPTLTEDLLEIHFKTQRTDGADIWVASRSTIGESFGPPAPAPGLDTVGNQDTPEILGDGLTLYFSASATAGATDVFRVTRADRSSAWGAAVIIDALSTRFYEFGPVADASETHIVFSRFVPSPRNHQLFQSRRASIADDWGPPEVIAELDGDDFELDGHLSADGRVLYFGTGSRGDRAEEIFRTERPSADAPFQAPVQLTELSSEGSDTDPWVSADERVMVFTSDRSGRNEIYVATRDGGRF